MCLSVQILVLHCLVTIYRFVNVCFIASFPDCDERSVGSHCGVTWLHKTNVIQSFSPRLCCVGVRSLRSAHVKLCLTTRKRGQVRKTRKKQQRQTAKTNERADQPAYERANERTNERGETTNERRKTTDERREKLNEKGKGTNQPHGNNEQVTGGARTRPARIRHNRPCFRLFLAGTTTQTTSSLQHCHRPHSTTLTSPITNNNNPNQRQLLQHAFSRTARTRSLQAL